VAVHNFNFENSKISYIFPKIGLNKIILRSFDRMFEDMEVKLRAMHQEELEHLDLERKAQAEFSKDVAKRSDDFLFGERRRLIRGKREAQNEASEIWGLIRDGDQRCVH